MLGLFGWLRPILTEESNFHLLTDRGLIWTAERFIKLPQQRFHGLTVQEIV
jgi:hypothetical protein